MAGGGATIIGIDLGTTYSCVGVYKNGHVEIIANDQGNCFTPSCVAFTDNGRLIGEAAKNQATVNAERTIFNVKRLIGRKFEDEEVQREIKFVAYKIVNKGGKPYIQVKVRDGETKVFSPEEISAMVLTKMKEIAEAFLKEKIRDVVISVPANFNDAQRQATKDAGIIAGLKVARLINEPTAAAVAYHPPNNGGGRQRILVFDLGGGTFDVSILDIDSGVFNVRLTCGDTHLGGANFDQRVMENFIKLIKEKHGKDISQDKWALGKLRRECERAKRALSSEHEVRVEIESLYDGMDFSEPLTRARFEELNSDLFRKTIALVKNVVGRGKTHEVNEIILVGGSTRIPKIQQLLKGYFRGKEPSKGVKPDEAVAYGAAALGGILSVKGGHQTKDILQEVAAIGLRTALSHGRWTSNLLDGNSHIPKKISAEFKTSEDRQTTLTIEVFEGTEYYAKDCRWLGEFKLAGIPSAPRGTEIEVTFEVDTNGILVDVMAEDVITGDWITVTSKKVCLSQDEIERMTREVEAFAEEDKRVMENIDHHQRQGQTHREIGELGGGILNGEGGEEIEADAIIGIELGTTYSCVSIYKNGHVEIIDNDKGKCFTPSAVAFTDSGRLIGEDAMNQATVNAERTIFNVKRLIGRKFEDEEVQREIKFVPYKIVNKDGKPYIQVKVRDGENMVFSPEEITAMVLCKMKEIAEAFLGKKIKDAVISVPANFNDAQRQATRDAGIIAGLNVAKIINEPTAAAIAYGRDKKVGEKRRILVFDLGGGTFDVSILEIDSGVFKVLATNGDTHLGGADFDQRIMGYFIELIKEKHGKDISQDTWALGKLSLECRHAKRALSSEHQVRVEIESLHHGMGFSEPLTRAQFEDLNDDLFGKIMGHVKKAMEDSGLGKHEIDEIVLVGGSTKIPKVQQLLKDYFDGKEPNKAVNLEKAVAHGAAALGGIISGEGGEETLKDILLEVAPLALRIGLSDDGWTSELIGPNFRIPKKISQEFKTMEDQQTTFPIKVFEGESDYTKDCRWLGEFTLTGIPPAPRGTRIEVTFEVDANGILINVMAEDVITGESITVTSDKSRLSQEEIERMVREVEEFAEEDMKVKEKIEHDRRQGQARRQIEELGGGTPSGEGGKEIEGLLIKSEEPGKQHGEPFGELQKANEQKLEFEQLQKQHDEPSKDESFGELQKVNEQTIEFEQLRKQRDELFGELQKLNEQKVEFEQLREQYNELSGEHQKANEQKIEFKQLKKQHDELFEELQTANEQTNEAFRELRKANEQKNEIFGELQKANEQKIEFEQLKKQHDEILVELQKANEQKIEFEQLQKQRDELFGELKKTSEQEIEFQQLKKQHEELLGELHKANEQKIEFQQLRKQHDELVRELQKANEQKIEFEQLKKQHAELCGELQKANEQLRRGNFSHFSYLELQQATLNFTSKIGEGGYGGVYKGFLRHTTVAVKMLNPKGMQGQQEFNQEVDVLSRVRHPNLVTLVGACPEAWALVYEFLPSGSLEDYLPCKGGTLPLSWQARTRIANEICSALIFLHSHQPEIVVHGDLKPENILLDANCVSKLSDFGICRLLARSNSTATIIHRTEPKGTSFYMDPLFVTTDELTTHSDVYSFGIILLQLLTGRPPRGIAREVQAALEKGSLYKILDTSAGNWPIEESHQLANLALRCCDLVRRNRPDLANDTWKVLKGMMKAATSMGSSSSSS